MLRLFIALGLLGAWGISAAQAGAPAAQVNALQSRIKKSKKVARYIRYSLQLGHLYRKHKEHGKAQSVFGALAKKYPKPQVLCVTHHFIAQSLLSQNKTAAGLARYKSLLGRFRGCQCRYVPNAYVAMGRAAFDQKRYGKALGLYGKAPRCRENRIAAIAAAYMKGWCAYKLKQYPQAYRAMSTALRQMRRESRRAKGEQKARLRKVQKEAWPNFVRAFSRAGNPSKAWRTFRQVADDAQAQKMLDQLAASYRGTKAHRKLIALFKRMARAKRRSPRQVHYWLEILRASYSIKDWRGLMAALGRLRRAIQKHRSKASGDPILAKEIKAARKQIGNFGKYLHSQAQKNGKKLYYQRSARFLAAYHELFPKAKDAHVLSYWQGEVLLELKKYDQAAAAYTRCARSPHKSKHTRDATYKAALAHHRRLKNAQSLKYKKPTAKKQARAKKIPKKYLSFLAAGTYYRSRYPKDKDVTNVAYNMGLVYQKYNHWEKARVEFVFVVKNHTRTRYALPAAYHVIDTLRIRQQWKLLHQWGKAFAGIPSLGRRLFKKQMLSISRVAGIKLCVIDFEAKKFVRAAQCFETMAKDPGAKRQAPNLLYNAYVALRNAKKDKAAARVKKKLLQTYPNSSFARNLKKQKK